MFDGGVNGTIVIIGYPSLQVYFYDIQPNTIDARVRWRTRQEIKVGIYHINTVFTTTEVLP